MGTTVYRFPSFHRTRLCKHVSSRLGALLGQKQVVELDDDIGKVGELHEVRGDDVDPVHPRPLSLDPGNDGWQVPGAAREDKSENTPVTQLLALKEKTTCPVPGFQKP